MTSAEIAVVPAPTEAPPPTRPAVQPKDLEPEIESVLVLSTQHLPPGGCDGPHFPDGVSVETLEYGWMVYVCADDDCYDELPGWLEVTLALARERGCRWVRYDADGPYLACLDSWQW